MQIIADSSGEGNIPAARYGGEVNLRFMCTIGPYPEL